jgi:prepilin-type processing-associated H-X9-DG protein
MNSRSIPHVVVVLFAAALMVAPARRANAQPLADRIPGDAVVYIGWAGADHMGAGFEQSRLKAVLDASNFPQLVNDSLPRFFQKLGAQNRDAAEFTSLFSAIGSAVWKHPTALYFGGLNTTDPKGPMPRLALICEAGQDGQALVAQIEKAVATSGAPVQVQQQGGTVVVSVAGTNLAPGAKPANALPAAAKFKAAAAQVGGAGNAVATIYVDVEGVVGVGDQIVKGDADVAATWNKIKTALGLGGIKRFIWSAGFDGRDWMGQAFVDAPAPRQGVLPSLLDAKPLTEAVFKSIPQTATVASAGRCDLGALFRNIRSALGQIDPNMAKEFEGALTQVKDTLGLDVQTDLFDVLGDEWAVYIDPPSTGSGLFGFVLVNRAKNAAKLEDSLTKIENLANALIKQNMQGGPVTIEVKRAQSGNATLHYLAIPFVAPTWTIKDGNLYVGLFPQVVAGALDNTAAGKSILESQEFQAVRQRLGAQATGSSITGFSFSNLPQTAPDGYQELMMVSRVYLGMADIFGADTPPLVLPPLRKILPHLIPAGSVSWVDQAGWHHKSITPFPGAGALTPGAGGQVILAQQAMMISILLPSLNRARETANRVKCGSNMRQIGQGILLHANENRGRYPENLGILLNQDLTPDVFVCPSGSNGLPANIAQMKREEIMEWINANADYVYVGQGLNTTAGPDVLVLYEKPDAHGQQGMNMLFGDGHVDFVSMQAAQQQIAKAQQRMQRRPALPRPGQPAQPPQPRRQIN